MNRTIREINVIMEGVRGKRSNKNYCKKFRSINGPFLNSLKDANARSVRERMENIAYLCPKYLEGTVRGLIIMFEVLHKYV